MTESFIFEYVLTSRRKSDAAQASRPFEQRRVRVDRLARILESFSNAATAATAAANHHCRRQVGRSSTHRFHRCSKQDEKNVQKQYLIKSSEIRWSKTNDQRDIESEGNKRKPEKTVLHSFVVCITVVVSDLYDIANASINNFILFIFFI